MLIGMRIKEIRNDKKMSIRELALKTGLSPASLSNIEREINSPTINSLNKICDALDIHIIDLLKKDEKEKKEKIVYRKIDRHPLVTSGEQKTKYEIISLPDKQFKMLAITIPPNSGFGYTSHGFPSDEIGLVIKGKMEIMVDDELYLLNEGDTIYLQANSFYKYRNISEDECLTIWALRGTSVL